MTASWHSERFPPTGGIGGTGAGNVLGRPHLTRRAVLVRESIQNSNDAGHESKKPISYSIAGQVLAGPPRDALVAALGPAAPSRDSVALGESLRKKRINVLTISDRGTRGLGGPTRADRIETGAVPRDFVAFVRNIGQPSDKHGNGGTWGYGKGCFYGFSHAQTILIDTQILRGAVPERRLIAASLGKEFQAVAKSVQVPFTGRHWWGELRDEVPEPLSGSAASDLAAAIGLPDFKRGETGTSITIIDPAFEDEPTAEIGLMAEALMWWAWPLLIPDEGDVIRVAASMSWDGEPIAVPDPAKHPVLRTFVAAYRNATSGESIPISTTTHKIGEMGRLGIHRNLTGVMAARSAEHPMPETVRHVALMRMPRLVVRYEQVTPLPVDGVDFAGVFMAQSLHDRAFANSEPPTHDDWVSSQLQGIDRTVVRTSLAHIKDQMKQHLVVDGPKGPGAADTTSMAAASAMFASIVAGTKGSKAGPFGHNGPGGGGGGGGAGGGGGSSHPTARVDALDYAADGDSTLVALLTVSGTATGNVELRVEAAIGVDGGREAQAPVGAASPVVLSLVGPDGTRHEGGSVRLAAGSDGIWEARIKPVDDTVTEVAVRIVQ